MIRVVLAVGLVWWAMAGAIAETAESRVGRSVWARPAITERSVDVYADGALRSRIPLSTETELRIVGIVFGGPWPHKDPIYRFRLPDDRDAYLPVAEFEARLYRELGPNEVATSPYYVPPLGQGVQVSQFERSSFFAADPRVMEPRIVRQGPRTFVPVRPRVGPMAPVTPAEVTTRKIDPAEPVIRPR